MARFGIPRTPPSPTPQLSELSLRRSSGPVGRSPVGSKTKTDLGDLPAELLERIIWLALAVERDHPYHKRLAQFCLTCRYWNRLIQSCREVWTFVDLSFGVKWMRKALPKSGGARLSFQATCSPSKEDPALLNEFLLAICYNAHRCSSLFIHFEDHVLDFIRWQSMIKVLRCDYPVLHSFSIKLGSQSPIVRLPDTGTFTTTRSDGDLVPYPPLYPWHGDLPSRLTSFRLSYTRFDVRGVFWNTASTSCRVRIAPLLETLRACSNLEELVLDRSVEGSRIIDTPSSIPPPFTLPRLTKVSMIDLDVPTVNTILGTLLLPRCEFLNIRCDMRRYGFNDLADQQALDLISSMVKHTKVVSIEEVYGEMLQFAYQHHPDELLESGVFFSLSNVLDKPYFVERFLNLVPATSISSIRIGIRTLDILLVIETVSHLVEDLTIINRDPHIWEEAIEFLIASVRTGNWGKLTSFTAISSPNWDFQVDDFIRFLDAWADSRSGDAETRPKFKKLHIVGGLKNLREYGVDAFRRRVETLKVRDLIY